MNSLEKLCKKSIKKNSGKSDLLILESSSHITNTHIDIYTKEALGEKDTFLYEGHWGRMTVRPHSIPTSREKFKISFWLNLKLVFQNNTN